MASESQPRFGQSVKGLLSDKVGSCSGDVIALTRQVLKGSRSQELLGQAARNMVIQEDAILHSEDCGALQKPAGPAETLAEVTEQKRTSGGGVLPVMTNTVSVGGPAFAHTDNLP
ncbi:BLOC-1-related complex subunit 7 isoform X1 [Siniperca chuatsi]|uniref:BLOC-1-related complex subunit 7 isoform X1 n=1 Tax=Siniperca chuatsi TaxID=119488 RepID=UPI001CE20EEB|nr:BLOC-1-related complex subunit 7 isoform X1 [Siniperca chuatsi]